MLTGNPYLIDRAFAISPFCERDGDLPDVMQFPHQTDPGRFN